MGFPPADWGRAKRSADQVQVRLTRPFLLAETEFTRSAWQATGFALPVQRDEPPTEDECLDGTCPIAQVSFWDVLAVVNHLSEQAGLSSCYDLSACSGVVGDGYSCESVLLSVAPIYACEGYRLPSEAEWEYASRAGTLNGTGLGDVLQVEDCDDKVQPALEPIAWYCRNSDNHAHPVGLKAANGWGLKDMLGNVGEWVNDLLHTRGYGEGPLTDPPGVLTPGIDITSAQDKPRGVRGGSFYSATIWPVHHSWPGTAWDHYYQAGVGFRLARTLKE